MSPNYRPKTLDFGSKCQGNAFLAFCVFFLEEPPPPTPGFAPSACACGGGGGTPPLSKIPGSAPIAYNKVGLHMYLSRLILEGCSLGPRSLSMGTSSYYLIHYWTTPRLTLLTLLDHIKTDITLHYWATPRLTLLTLLDHTKTDITYITGPHQD